MSRLGAWKLPTSLTLLVQQPKALGRLMGSKLTKEACWAAAESWSQSEVGSLEEGVPMTPAIDTS